MLFPDSRVGNEKSSVKSLRFSLIATFFSILWRKKLSFKKYKK